MNLVERMAREIDQAVLGEYEPRPPTFPVETFSNANPVIHVGPVASAEYFPSIDEDDPRLKPHHCQVCGHRYRRLELLAGRR